MSQQARPKQASSVILFLALVIGAVFAGPKLFNQPEEAPGLETVLTGWRQSQPDENEVLLEAGWLKEGISLEMEAFAAVTYSYKGVTMPVRRLDPFTAGAWRVHVIILPHVRGKVSISVTGPRNTATTYCAITRKGGERVTQVGSGQAQCVANV